MERFFRRCQLGVGLVVALLLVGALPGLTAEKTVINFWHAMGGQLGETVQALVNSYNQSQSTFEVKALYKGSYAECMTGAIAAYRAKNQPHIVQVFEVGTQTMMLSGAIYPVYKLMEDQGVKMDWDNFVAPVLGYYSKEGDLYSMPFNSSTPILYYNKTAFKKAGLDPNKPPTTWQEIEQFSRALVKSGATEAGFSVGWPCWTMIENMHAWHGQPVATKNNGFSGLDVELLINREFGVKHLGQLAAWHKEGLFRYGGRAGNADPMFVNGQVGIYMQSSALIGNFTRSCKFEWGTSYLPHWGAPYKKVNSIIGGATLWVLAGHKSKDYQGVASFLKFVSEPAQQAFWHKNTGYVAISHAAQDALEKEGYLQKQPNQRTAFAQLTLSPPLPYTRGVRLGNYSQIRDIIEEEMENIFNGKKGAKQGLDDAVNRANVVLKEFAQLYN